MRSLALPAYAQLSDADEAALTDLYSPNRPERAYMDIFGEHITNELTVDRQV